MSSCFLCDCSYKFIDGRDLYDVTYSLGNSEGHYMLYMPIMVGSSGTKVNDQQHKDNNKQNYVSYIVKRLEFEASVHETGYPYRKRIPDYILIFKVPFRQPVFDYYFTIMKNFMLFSEPECVLKYGVYNSRLLNVLGTTSKEMSINNRKLIIDKPFIVGPNDYVGVLYMFASDVIVNASARVWFDVL